MKKCCFSNTDSIRDDVLVATFLHPSNVCDPLFATVDGDGQAIPTVLISKVKELQKEEITALVQSGIHLRPVDSQDPPSTLDELLGRLEGDFISPSTVYGARGKLSYQYPGEF